MRRAVHLLWFFATLWAGSAAAGVEVGVTLHVARGDGGPVAEVDWLWGQLAEANRLFEPAGVRFRPLAGPPLTDPGPVIAKVAGRNALATRAVADGTIHVFVVDRLADKSRAGVWIAGVHWRYAGSDSALSGRRYIIVARAAARADTLAHELGHFFGLPHAAPEDNLMKRRPRAADCSLSAWQVKRILRRLTRFLRRRTLNPIGGGDG